MSQSPPPPNLRLAITGLPSAGKTTLLNHIRAAWPAPQLPPPPPQPHRRSRLNALPFAPRLLALFRTLARLRRLRRAPASEVPLADGGVAWDAPGGLADAVAKASGGVVDVVLYVTRLDHGRASREDVIGISEVALRFGMRGVECMIVVLTRGWGGRAVGVGFEGVVRGRRDLIWRFVADYLPPIYHKEEDEEEEAEDEEEEAEDEDGTKEVDGGDTEKEESEEATNNGEIEREGEGGEDIDEIQPVLPSQPPRVNENADSARRGEQGRSLLARLHEKLDEASSDNDSISHIPTSLIDQQYDDLLPPYDKRRYVIAPTPPVVVVELSDSCPVGDDGQKILPDGTAWLPKLLEQIRATAELSRAHPRVEEPERRETFLESLKSMWRSLKRDGLRIVLAEIALGVLVVQMGKVLRKLRERKDSEEDLVLEVPDEEWEKLNRKERVVWRFDEKGRRTIHKDLTEEEKEAKLLMEEEEQRRQQRGQTQQDETQQNKAQLNIQTSP